MNQSRTRVPDTCTPSANHVARPAGAPSVAGNDAVKREIAIMKKLIHPNVVRLYEVIDDDVGQYIFLALEYVPGGVVYEPAAYDGGRMVCAHGFRLGFRFRFGFGFGFRHPVRRRVTRVLPLRMLRPRDVTRHHLI